MDSPHPHRIPAFRDPAFTLFSDLSVHRHPPFPIVPASHHFSHDVATTDVVIDPSTRVWARIFLPHSTQKRLPVVLYAHGGAYCTGDPNWSIFHGFCHRMAVKSQAIWVSLSYRLAPEHRLPAAYEDGYSAFTWLRSVAASQANGTLSQPWLDEFGDFSRCFLAGDSAGATIMFNVAMRVAEEDRAPLNVLGLMLVHPGFHMEANGNLVAGGGGINGLYKLALPKGANMDYPRINPLHPAAPSLCRLSAYLHVLVAVAEQDGRYDLTMKFYKTVKAFCDDVQLVVSMDKGHAFHIEDAKCTEAAQLEQELATFVCTSH